MSAESIAAYESGLGQLRQGRFGEAIQEFHRALRADHQFLDAYYHLALAHFRRGEVEKAEEILRRLHKLTKDDPSVHLLFCQVLREQGKKKEAYRALGPVLAAKSLDEEAALDASYELLNLGHRRAAIRLLERQIRRNPRSPQLVYRLGRTLADLGRESEAMKYLEKCLELQPDHTDAKRAIDRILRESEEKKPKGWLPVGRKDSNGKTSAAVSGMEKLAEGDAASAAKLLAEAHNENRDPGLELALACAYESEGRHEDAITVLERIRDEPDVRGFASYRLGRLYYQAGRNEDAAEVLTTALEEDPDFEEARDLLVEIMNLGG